MYNIPTVGQNSYRNQSSYQLLNSLDTIIKKFNLSEDMFSLSELSEYLHMKHVGINHQDMINQIKTLIINNSKHNTTLKKLAELYQTEVIPINNREAVEW